MAEVECSECSRSYNLDPAKEVFYVEKPYSACCRCYLVHMFAQGAGPGWLSHTGAERLQEQFELTPERLETVLGCVWQGYNSIGDHQIEGPLECLACWVERNLRHGSGYRPHTKADLAEAAALFGLDHVRASEEIFKVQMRALKPAWVR